MMLFSIHSCATWLCRILVFSSIALLPQTSPVAGQTLQFPGGFLEKSYAPITRPRLTAAQIQSFLPAARGQFTFPAPYNTTGIRLTIPSDCSGGTDCVRYVGYSYWRNINNHVGSDTMYIFLGLTSVNGGPTLFSYNKVTDVVTKVGPLFDAGSNERLESGEGWYFSATQPTKLYLSPYANRWQLWRYDVITRTHQVVFDVDNCAACGPTGTRSIRQIHSSDDDLVHSFTVLDKATSVMLGCGIYKEASAQFSFFPRVTINYNECNLDKSGRWLVILDGSVGLDTYVHDLQGGSMTLILDQAGGLGHLDMGDGYAVGADNFNPLPNASILIQFPVVSVTRPVGPVVHYNPDWNTAAAQHISHQNRKSGVAPSQQYACGSDADGITTRANEIVCFRLDSTYDELVVAPVMTDMSASGGVDSYGKDPKGNLDVTGQYFIWTSNMGGNRLDAFLVKVPSHLLTGDTTPPTAPTNLQVM